MTIVSHKYKFIYMKTHKTGGSSVYSSLCKHLGEEDYHLNQEVLNESGIEPLEKHEFSVLGGPDLYASPAEIKEKVGEEIWNSYLKVTNVRNPWDAWVSMYHWDRDLCLEKKSKYFFENFFHTEDCIDEIRAKFKRYLYWALPLFKKGNTWSISENEVYLYDEDKKLIPDYVIRYESLQEDYDTFCREIGIPKNKLLKLKTKHRKKYKKYFFKDYYDGKMYFFVRDNYRSTIRDFNYEF